MEKSPSGNSSLDKFLQGGYEKGIVTTIYGPAGSGKTLFLMLAMKETDPEKKILFVDTEGGFSTERFTQVCPYHLKVLDRTMFLNPTNFDDQEKAIKELKNLMNMDLSMVIVDTLSALYRVEMNSEDNYGLNKRLAKQLRDLVELARKKEIPVMVTSQVYSDMEDPDKLNVVGGTIVRNMSKCLIELRKDNNERKITLKKHRSMPQKEMFFKIVQDGIEGVK